MLLNNSRIAKFTKREKRFLVYWQDGTRGYCPNTGKMSDILKIGSDCLITPITTKSQWQWEASFIQNTWVGVNTHNPNKLIKNYLTNIFPDQQFKAEVSFNDKFRADFANENIVIEVKNVHWKVDSIARFPDCVTSRGARQMLNLTELQKNGKQCYVIYVIQRSDVNTVGCANWIDKEYFVNSTIAKESGVKFLGFKCKITPQEIKISDQIEVI